MSRLILAAAFALSLAACGQPAPDKAEEPPVIGTPIDSTATPPAPAPQADATGALPQTLPAPSETTPRFVGLWAVSPGLCTDPAWRFEPNEVSTQGEVHCDFNRVLPTPGGYSIAATCTAEGPPTPHQIEFTFAESARSMMILGGPWGHASLVYCGPLPGN